MRKSLFIIGLILLLSGTVEAGEDERELRPYRCVFRINTTISAGSRTPEEIAQMAEEQGIDVLVFSDQFLVRGEWGIPGFRGLFKFTKSRPSVMSYGVSNYLARLRKIQRAHPDLVIVPGLDVAPHYYWEGWPGRKDFSVHQWSEQLTVVGLDDPARIRKMPVTANPDGPRRWTVMSFVKLLPGLLVLLGIWIRRRKGFEYVDEQGTQKDIRDPRMRWLGLFVSAGGFVLLLSGYPFAERVARDQYSPTNGPEPFQQYLDWLSVQEGALAFWSAPEITHEETINGVRLVTRPYLNHVEETTGASGFAGIYADARTACKPGKLWDRTLVEYCREERESPLHVVSESDYHTGERLDARETILLMPDLSPESVMRALTTGRMYARARGRDGRIELLDFSVSEGDGRGHGFMESVRTDSQKLKIHVKIRARLAEKTGDTVFLQLIQEKRVKDEEKIVIERQKSGEEWSGVFKVRRTDPARMTYFRLRLRGRRTGEIVTNPIFIYPGEIGR
ncbi:MAG: hypothetical protein KGZ25_04565 [Planctomycetes bacterium]|nr:hypothetical protein [Planctomycetota bacterium]